MNFIQFGIILLVLTIIFTILAIKRKKDPTLFVTVPFWLLVPSAVVWVAFFFARGGQ
ncbi:MAG: hypothetical protein UR79_C0001G0303 [Candidatus Campbellbacteria bacterium GW2011_GWD1_35_49]|nr:MAG: hypothetical protein UR74_C0001G0026 [Candidatus Campbellbacteria bacterium GW2011_GWD2_35_24]KKP76269.1 MAG: hypothetical protein UR75_C0001G0303 [Candidatus Campbellbacteria bacterium GW2011_GWC2_35_28]KKP77458.1 MAG: hypothetical protein UR76_C0001G0303 [Candidatus Campbellbacteria bacterium GW2011_GWC1_35_31]KKP79387.1 MAG: hypothetical protein UR79_C0001G0303 [Candidatus Campbellbacteria bacterium GW2011_GWD1_35_49]